MSAIRKAKNMIRNICRISSPYAFIMTDKIQEQRISFQYHGKKFVIEADHSVPLYDTISEIIDYDCYFLERIKKAAFTKESIAVDIGGNIGIFAIVLSSFFPGSIHCFEPVEENCEFLKKNIKLNRIKNIVIHQKAVSLKNGKIPFFLTDHSMGGTTSKHSLITQECLVESIDSANLAKQFPKIDILKMDCEGEEHSILPKLLASKAEISFITAELHDTKYERKIPSLLKLLQSYQYQISIKKEMFGRFGLKMALGEKSLF